MKLFKFLRTMVVMTLLSLIYINLQMQILGLAYEGKRKEKEIRRLNDNNSQLTYRILTLKSANHLGDRLLTQETHMQFLDTSRIVRLVTPTLAQQQEKTSSAKKQENTLRTLLSFFSLKSQAEAKPIER